MRVVSVVTLIWLLTGVGLAQDKPKQAVQQGLTALFNSAPRVAVGQFEQVLDNRPTPEQRGTALFYLGYANEKLGRPKQALAWYGKLIALRPASSFQANALYRSGLLHERAKDYPRAIQLYEQVGARHPKQTELGVACEFNAANLKLLQKKDFKGAIKSYRKVITLCGNSPRGYPYFSSAARQRIDFLKRNAGEGQALPRYLDALRLKREGKYAAALALLDELVRKASRSRLAPAAWLEIADCHFRQRNWGRTISVCDTFVKRYPKHAELPGLLLLRKRAQVAQLQGQIQVQTLRLRRAARVK